MIRYMFPIALVALAISNATYWSMSDHEAASRDSIAAFSNQCQQLAEEFNATHSEPVRARAFEQNLTLLKTHPLTGAAQCTQVRGRCEVGYAVAGDTASSWYADARFVERSMHRCIFPLTALGGMGGLTQVELLE